MSEKNGSPKVSPKAVIWVIFACFGVAFIWGTYVSVKALRAGHSIDVTLPIQANDQTYANRGEFLVYQVDYGSSFQCPQPRLAIMCLRREVSRWVGEILPPGVKPKPQQCHAYIRGTCKYDQFYAKIEHIQAQQQQVSQMKSGLRWNTGSIHIKVDSKGTARIEQLFIGDKPWQEFIRNPRQ